jgi:glycosyltransferase involved in cell wall biosynthesis/SAM-dependent methyltransferase
MVDKIADNTERLYTADYFEKLESTKNGYTDYLSSPAANLIGKYAFTRLVSSDDAKFHLDLGCADGSLMDIFKSEGFSTQGLEISKDAVTIANNKGLDVVLSNLHTFPSDTDKKDIITAFDLLEHADQPGRVLKNIYKSLQDDGQFIFSTLSVKKNTPTDYWFNNSLEHYVYYTKESLDFILKDIFGEGNYCFIEIDSSAGAEFWGVAKKRQIGSEKKHLDYIAARKTNITDHKAAYWLSLFNNQIARFDVSNDIIENFADKWDDRTLIKARFYNDYSQGKFANAMQVLNESNYVIPSSEPIFWHAVYDAKTRLSELEKATVEKESNEQIIELRDEVFKLRDKLFALHNSKAVRYAMAIKKGAAQARSIKNKSKHLPRNTLKLGYQAVRRAAILTVPSKTRKKIKREFIDTLRERIKKTRQVNKVYVVVDADKWNADKPLVSVVIPYYNRADTIDDTLSSLRTQTFGDFEVIIVNDGSTDAQSIEKIKSLKKDSIVTKVITQKNQGVAAARNNGISQAQGKYIVCLDSDDMVQPTYLEKAALVLETHPDVSIVSTYMTMFGVKDNTIYNHSEYSPLSLYEDNMIITAAMFRKLAWEDSGGYKSDIGYEDWEFWLTLTENGHFTRQIPEALFRYRVAMSSRYVEDKGVHWRHVRAIHALHPNYKKTVQLLVRARRSTETVVTSETSMINMRNKDDYSVNGVITKKNILITMPWMVFGGAETLVYNYTKAIKDEYTVSFMTGIKSENEWEYKFAEIGEQIIHLPNLFEERNQKLEYILNFLETRNIHVLQLVHNEFMLEFLPEIRLHFPDLKIVITMFNDSVDYFPDVVSAAPYVDAYVSDNDLALKSLAKASEGNENVLIRRIPNGVDATTVFNPKRYDRDEMRKKLGMQSNEVAVFFIGRLSQEKNPNVFIDVARDAMENKSSTHRFFMIGDGIMKDQLVNNYKDVMENDKFEYLGYQKDVSKYLAAADVFILPSSIEGFPLSVIEAMAMRVVSICSRVGALPSVIHEGVDGYLVTPGSSKEIYEKLMKIKSDKALEDMKDNARELVMSNYTIEILGRNYKDIYGDLL